MKKAVLMLGLFLGFFASACMATTYSQTITTLTSSLTITQAQHGFSSTKLGIVLYDANGVVQPNANYSYSINGSTYDISMTFSPAVSSGSVSVFGTFTANTTASSDFKVSAADGATHTVTVCSACSSAAYAARSLSGVGGFVLGRPVVFTASLHAPNPTFTARAYILANVIVLGVSDSGSGVTFACSGVTAGACRIDYSISAFPTGSIQLGDVYFNGTNFGTVNDDRPASFQ